MSKKHHQHTFPYESKMKLSQPCMTQLGIIATCILLLPTNVWSLNIANSHIHSTNGTLPNIPGIAMYLHALVAMPLKQYSVDCCKGLHRILLHGFGNRPVCYWTLTTGVLLSCFWHSSWLPVSMSCLACRADVHWWSAGAGTAV